MWEDGGSWDKSAPRSAVRRRARGWRVSFIAMTPCRRDKRSRTVLDHDTRIKNIFITRAAAPAEQNDSAISDTEISCTRAPQATHAHHHRAGAGRAAAARAAAARAAVARAAALSREVTQSASGHSVSLRLRLRPRRDCLFGQCLPTRTFQRIAILGMLRVRHQHLRAARNTLGDDNNP